MELIDVSMKIESCISELDKLRLRLDNLDKSKAIANYEKEIAKTIIRLKNGVEFDLEGEKVVTPAVSIIDKIARGICWREKLEQDKKETEYKAIVESIEIVKSQLTAYQSINRSFSHL